jgi:uncharacterized protein YdcH (DUF465 family)
MTDARRVRSTLDPNRLMKTVEDGLERNRQSMEDGQAAITERLDAAFSRIDDRFSGLERDIRSGNVKRDELATEVQELRRQVLDTRDAIQKDGGAQTQAAAQGAAAGAAGVAASVAAHAIIPAVTAAMRIDPKAVVRAAMETTTGRLLGIAAGIATIGSGIENVPKIVKWVGAIAVGVWHFLGADVK